MKLDLAYFAYLSLGGFVAGMMIVGLRTVKDNADAFVKISNTTVFAALTGAGIFPLITFVTSQTKTSGPAIYMYPIGLGVTMLWFYAEDAQRNIESKEWKTCLLGWVQMLATWLASLAVLLICVLLGLQW